MRSKLTFYIFISFTFVCAFFASRYSRESFSWPGIVLYVFMWSGAALFLTYRYRTYLENIRTVIFVFAALSLLFLFRPYLLSDDVERYVWEGHVQNLGFNPYAAAPNDPQFADEVLNKKVNHPQMTAIYPPFMQLTFRFLAFIQPSVQFFKIFFFLVSVFFVYFLWKQRDFFHDGYIIAGIFPFLAVETSWSGHLEVLAILFLAAAVVYMKKKKYLLSGLFLGLSGMSKLIPALLVVYFVKELYLQHKENPGSPENKNIRNGILFTAGFAAPFFLYAPYLWVGGYLISSLAIYSNQWVFGSFFYSLLGFTGMGNAYIRIFCILALGIAGLLILFKGKSLNLNIFYFMLSLSVFSPVVHPWYLLWLIPFSGKEFFNTSIAFLAASFLMYEVLADLFAKNIWDGNRFIPLFYTVALSVFFMEFLKMKRTVRIQNTDEFNR